MKISDRQPKISDLSNSLKHLQQYAYAYKPCRPNDRLEKFLSPKRLSSKRNVAQTSVPQLGPNFISLRLDILAVAL